MASKTAAAREERIGRIGQRRQVVIPREIIDEGRTAGQPGAAKTAQVVCGGRQRGGILAGGWTGNAAVEKAPCWWPDRGSPCLPVA